jgi:hypothetical protein
LLAGSHFLAVHHPQSKHARRSLTTLTFLVDVNGSIYMFHISTLTDDQRT